MSDPIGAAIEAAVARAIEAQLPNIVEAVAKRVSVPVMEEPDRFVPVREAAPMLGISPSTAWRLEQLGMLPPRERINGKTGYRLSTIKKILDDVVNKPMLPSVREKAACAKARAVMAEKRKAAKAAAASA